MKKDFLFKNLIEVLQDRIPQRGRLAEELTELLGIEKEAVYRRLRGSVPFSFQEIYKISTNLGFSLDSIAASTTPENKQVSVLMLELPDLQENDYKKIEEFTDNIGRLKEDKDSESGAIGSIIPASFSAAYENIFKFYIFKRSYQFANSWKRRAYAETNTPERIKQINRELVENVRNSPKSVYIFDRQFIEYFVKDVLFFFDIRMISRDDVLLLKGDLHLLINDLERFSTNGCFDSGSKVEIYLANIHFDANYNYIDATSYKLTTMRSFAFTDSYSFDEAVFQNMKNWLTFLKRTSTLISEGNASERIRFFETQRKIVDSL